MKRSIRLPATGLIAASVLCISCALASAQIIPVPPLPPPVPPPAPAPAPVSTPASSGGSSFAAGPAVAVIGTAFVLATFRPPTGWLYRTLRPGGWTCQPEDIAGGKELVAGCAWWLKHHPIRHARRTRHRAAHAHRHRRHA